MFKKKIIIEVVLFSKEIFYLFIHERYTQREAETEQACCREPNAGLNPRTLGSGPELKADAQPLSHPGVPEHA